MTKPLTTAEISASLWNKVTFHWGHPFVRATLATMKDGELVAHLLADVDLVGEIMANDPFIIGSPPRSQYGSREAPVLVPLAGVAAAIDAERERRAWQRSLVEDAYYSDRVLGLD